MKKQAKLRLTKMSQNDVLYTMYIFNGSDANVTFY